MTTQGRPSLTTKRPEYEQRVWFDKDGERHEALVRVVPGDARAAWEIPGLAGSYRTKKDALAAISGDHHHK